MTLEGLVKFDTHDSWGLECLEKLDSFDSWDSKVSKTSIPSSHEDSIVSKTSIPSSLKDSKISNLYTFKQSNNKPIRTVNLAANMEFTNTSDRVSIIVQLE